MKAAYLVLLSALLSTRGGAQEYLNALWRQELMWTRLVGDDTNSYRVNSSIITGTVGVNAAVRYSLEVKVKAWDKPYRVTNDSGPERQTFTITLHETSDPREMEAAFEHVVYDGRKVKLRFAGVTRLVRSN